MLSRLHTLPLGFVPPCLPTKAPHPPVGGLWLHEIKHDGFRVIARKDGERVKLYSRPGNALTRRFPLIVEARGAGRYGKERPTFRPADFIHYRMGTSKSAARSDQTLAAPPMCAA